MRVVFVDESERDGQVYFIGALIADADAIRHIQASLDRIVAEASPGFDPDSEFHAYDMFHGEGDWSTVGIPMRAKACVLAVKSIANSGATFVCRGVDIERLRERYAKPYPVHELALAQALESADEWLTKQGDDAIVVADEHHTAEDGRRRFRRMTLGPSAGYSARKITRLVDTLYFGPSRHSRLLQAADLATYFTNRLVTVEREAPAARASMRKIRESLEKCTRRVYIWPTSGPRSTKPRLGGVSATAGGSVERPAQATLANSGAGI